MRNSKRLTSVVVLVAVFFILGGMGAASRSSDAAAVGELTSDKLFTLKDLEGKDVSLETLLKQNKAVLLNFWATWCPPCREEIPDLIAMQAKYKDSSFTILGIDEAESQKKVAAYVKKTQINYPVVLDADSAVAFQYNVVGIPTSILVNSERKVLGIYYGFTPELVRDVEEALKS